MIAGRRRGRTGGWAIETLRASTMRLRRKPLDLLPLVQLRQSVRVPTFYWSSPDNQERIVGVGRAYAIEAMGADRFRVLREACAAVTRHLEATAGDATRPVVRWFVGFAFDEEHGRRRSALGPSRASRAPAASHQTAQAPMARVPDVEDWWAPLPAAVAVLPEIMVVDRPRGSYLTVIAPAALELPPGTSLEDADGQFTPGWIDHGRTLSLLELIESIATRQRSRAGLDDPFNEPPIPGIPWPRPLQPPDRFRQAIAMPDLAITDTLICEAADDPQGAVDRRLRDAQARVAAGELERITMSVPCCVKLSRRPDSLGLVARLLEQEPECRVFLFTATPAVALAGASPTCLLRAVGRRLSTTVALDLMPGAALGPSDLPAAEAVRPQKAERAHDEMVVASTERALRSLAPAVRRIRQGPEPRLRRGSHHQHLEVRIEAERQLEVDVLDLVARLHPTPALAGWPLEAALGAIREIEPCSRGWCGGGVGWLDGKGNGDLALVAASLLVHGEAALTCAAVGISAESDLEAARRAIEVQLDAALAPLITPLRDRDASSADLESWLWAAPPARSQPIGRSWREDA